MSPPRGPLDPAALRRFLLAVAPDAGPARLLPEDERHAASVLRLRAGDHLIGLDGRGSAWPLRVRAAGRGGLELEVEGEPRREAAPGEAGAPLPSIELCLPLPRGERALELVESATALGAAALRFALTERTRPEARAPNANRWRRLERAAAEACKQCGRLWLPELTPPGPLLERALARPGASLVLLDPEPDAPLLPAHLRALGPASAGIVFLAGPEGGFSPAERETLIAAGAARARLWPHRLRMETAACAALAVAVQALAELCLESKVQSTPWTGWMPGIQPA